VGCESNKRYPLTQSQDAGASFAALCFYFAHFTLMPSKVNDIAFMDLRVAVGMSGNFVAAQNLLGWQLWRESWPTAPSIVNAAN